MRLSIEPSAVALDFPLPLPRKGTETSIIALTSFSLFSSFPTTFTPQGDGNYCLLFQKYSHRTKQISHYLYPARGRKLLVITIDIAIAIDSISHYLYPARGRKQRIFCAHWLKLQQISHYLYPARGRKPIGAVIAAGAITISHYLYPARGRKPMRSGWFLNSSTVISHYLYPARGRKHTTVEGEIPVLFTEFPTTFTPQGDGNCLRKVFLAP